VLISFSEPIDAKNLDALRPAAGVWKGVVDADALISNIIAARLIATRLPLRV
jgi:hypothetical protein